MRNDEEELHIEPRQELQSESTYGNSIRYVLEHGMESGVYFGVESGVTFGVVFFLILFKNAFCFITKIVIIIFCLLKVLFDGLTTLKSMAEVNKQKF